MNYEIQRTRSDIRWTQLKLVGLYALLASLFLSMIMATTLAGHVLAAVLCVMSLWAIGSQHGEQQYLRSHQRVQRRQ